MQLPLEDRYLMTRDELLHQLAVLLAGRTAEEIAFGRISTGAQNDLQRATDIARAMVTEYGMSDEIGLVNHGSRQRPTFLENALIQDRGVHSEETALKIDLEVKRFLDEAHDLARTVLRGRTGVLDRLSERLLEKEVIESDELLAIVGTSSTPDRTQTPA
jgi:cell division protease FtsH